MGAAEDEGRNADPAVAMAKMQLAKAAGFDTIRITAVWEPGQRSVPAGQLQALQSIAAAGDFLGIRVVATVMNFGSRTTPVTATARTQFARFAADMVKGVPSIREYIVGNEPNLNRYWLPQFGPNGEDAAATAYVQLLARTYDAMKAADKGVFIIGGSVSPRGLLGSAFDGTAQIGSSLPIVYDEYGVDSQIPDGKRRFYSGKEPATTKPASEGVQAAYYREALEIAACQPTVRGFLIFHVTDETDYNRWQSGVYYADGTPKSSRAFVKQTMDEIRSGAVECGGPPPPGPKEGWAVATAGEFAAAEKGSALVGGWVLVDASG